MNRLAVASAVTWMFAVSGPIQAAPLATSFTYQGQLKQGGAPYNGPADMNFTLWTAATAGSQVGPFRGFIGIAVVNGLFTVDLDFTAASYAAGEARFLQVEVKVPSGPGGTFTPLVPRQALNPTPYAVRALSANSLDAADGSPAGVVFVDNNGNVGVGTTTPESKLHVHKATAGTVTADTNSMAVFENSTNGYVTILTPDASERGLLFGEPSNSAAGGMMYNSGGTPDGLQFRTNGNVTRMSIDNGGNVGIGTADAATPLEVAMSDKRLQIRLDGGLVPGINLAGSGGNLGILRIRNAIEMWPDDAGSRPGKIALANAAATAFTIALDGGNGNASFTGNLSFGSATRQMLNLWTSEYGIGVQGYTEYFRSDGGFAWFNKGSHNDNTNNPGAGGSVLMVLNSSGNLGVGTTSPLAKLDVNGRTRTKSLEITGGADLAEPFVIPGDVEPGAVVVIDADRPGQLKVAYEPFDRKVAGIVSGANGLPAGMVLRGEGRSDADGGHLVAMTGRAWCKCDASFGAIRAGDLLTTSANPGHAMRIADDADAPRGSIIGKAMTVLENGQGLVLVLVDLQ
ncbi:MAG: hypothetical protein AABZ12_14910 [Planctomycetota bacterium]|mgnify:CR=1 FL=1